jgi:hypothetical protein
VKPLEPADHERIDARFNRLRAEFAAGQLTLDSYDRQIAGIAQEFATLMSADADEAPADAGPVAPEPEATAPPAPAVIPDLAEGVAWLREQYAKGMLSRDDAVSFGEALGAQIVPDDAREPAAEPALTTESTGDPALDARIADLRTKFLAGELDLAQVVAATQSLAASIAPTATPEPAAAVGPERPHLKTLMTLRRLIDAAGVIIDSYIEGGTRGDHAR